MEHWKQALGDGIVSGIWAATLSGIVLAACGRCEEGEAAGILSTPSKWVLGDHAAHVPRPGPGQTLVGQLIHTGATVFWAAVFERWRRAQHAPESLGVVAPAAVVTAAAACFGDYCVVPRRFSPGFERRLSRASLALVYAGIAIGLTSWRVRARRAARNLPAPRP